MHRWQDEESGGNERRSARARLVLGQGLVIAMIAGALVARSLLPNAEPRAQTIAVTAGQPTALPATSISARPTIQAPEEVVAVGRRFLTALARGDLSEAARDVAAVSAPTPFTRKLEGAAAAFQSTRARSFRVLFWQAGEPARLTFSFDYERSDIGEARSRVDLRLIQQDGRWVIVDFDLSAWLSDVGISRTSG
ncbi:MAG: hypothetical protein RMM58_07835 [Chloroflexota bacterium]|nr:hypothetical protein [Dehalococcoidia bacterium]MDW8253771.1 hypothetical protein [Chloroflexota bacterium]